MVSTQLPIARAAGWLLGSALGDLAFAWILLGAILFWSLRSAAVGLGIASDSTQLGGLHYEVAFVAILAAAALGLSALGRHRWPWPALGRLQRASAELAFLFALSAATVVLAWIPALARPAHVPWGLAAATLLHVIALAQLVSRLPMPMRLHPLLLVALVWWIPAIQGGGGRITGQVVGFLAPPGGSPMQMPGPADMAPALAFGLTAWLLTPKTPRP